MIEIYSKPDCRWCSEAKKLLFNNGLTYTEIDVTVGNNKELLLEKFPDVKSVPQIFENGVRIGGFAEMLTHFNIPKPTIKL